MPGRARRLVAGKHGDHLASTEDASTHPVADRLPAGGDSGTTGGPANTGATAALLRGTC
ncbi:MAG TPA: hypothetical protein VFM37_12230 [Pseudonocardiaceae bacterium]|nr:hypothetical protein [Pseudonocardiaceae bacterium]